MSLISLQNRFNSSLLLLFFYKSKSNEDLLLSICAISRSHPLYLDLIVQFRRTGTIFLSQFLFPVQNFTRSFALTRPALHNSSRYSSIFSPFCAVFYLDYLVNDHFKVLHSLQILRLETVINSCLLVKNSAIAGSKVPQSDVVTVIDRTVGLSAMLAIT